MQFRLSFAFVLACVLATATAGPTRGGWNEADDDDLSYAKTFSKFIEQHGEECQLGNWTMKQLEALGVTLEESASVPFNPTMAMNPDDDSVDDVYPAYGLEEVFIAVPGPLPYSNEKFSWIGTPYQKTASIPPNVRQIFDYVYTPATEDAVEGLSLQSYWGYNATAMAVGNLTTGFAKAPPPAHKKFPLYVLGNGYGDFSGEYHHEAEKLAKMGAVVIAIAINPGVYSVPLFTSRAQWTTAMQFVTADAVATVEYMWTRTHTPKDRLEGAVDWDLPVICAGHSLSGAACDCLALANGCPEFGVAPYRRFGIRFTKDPSSGWFIQNTSFVGHNGMRLVVPSYNSAGIMQEWRARDSNTNTDLNVVATMLDWSHQMYQWNILSWALIVRYTGDVANSFFWVFPGAWPVRFATTPPQNGWVLGPQPQPLQQGFNTFLELAQRLLDGVREGPFGIRHLFMTDRLLKEQHRRGWQNIIFIGQGGNTLATDLYGVNPPAPGQLITAGLIDDGVFEYWYYYSSSISGSERIGALSGADSAFLGSVPPRVSNILPGMRTWTQVRIKPDGNSTLIPFQPTAEEMGL